jgi:hypothetical protein
MRPATWPQHLRLAARRAAPGLRPGQVLAGALATVAAVCGLLAWNLEAVVGRYDTLAYLLEQAHTGEMTRLRGLFLIASSSLMALAVLAVFTWRLSLALAGGGLLLAGCLAGPLVGAYLAPAAGLEESLIYRLRGFSAIAVIGGCFLIFLAFVPALLDRAESRRGTVVWGRIRARVERLLSTPSWRGRVALGILAFALAAGVRILVLQDFPNSSDENSYLTQARIFAAGKLWVDAPAHPEFFRARSFVMDVERARFFAKAFPGWAAILSLGVRAGHPGAVNPLLSALTLILAGWLGRRSSGRYGEMAVLGLILASPFFLFNAASYFNHPAALLLGTLFLVCVLRLHEGGGGGWAVLAGGSAGAALWIRPGSALALMLPFGIWLGVTWTGRRRWGLLAAAAAPVVAALAGLAAYNRHMFGSMWQTGYGAYDPGDIRPGMGADHLAVTGWWLVKLCLWLVPGSLVGLWSLVYRRRWREWFQREPILVLMLVSLACLALSYLMFQNKGGNEYGPRYYYDGFTTLAVLLAAGWKRAPEALEGAVSPRRVRSGTLLVLGFGVFLTLAGAIPFLCFHYRDKIAHNRDLFVSVERAHLRSALIFLETGSGRMPPGDLVRNPPDFRTGVVYARDLGLEADRELASAYPDRPALVYAYDPRTRSSMLRPLEEQPRR